jgi:putative spermidine/putrescine transport system ATP-binding protein
LTDAGLSGRQSAPIRLDRITKIFDGAVRAVDDVSLDIAAGEFFSLLGPSGCGKTTSLRMIAGFETPDHGRIEVGGRDVTDVPVHRRNMGMVFQSYALLPHRTVAENVAFGLRMRNVPREEITRRVAHALRQVKLDGYEERRPSQLSGGQQQRVALARSIVIEPPVLLCDEPLGALDRKLRQAMQLELRELQHALGLTLVFVTHDQEEALAMSDRIAVMRDGRIEQIGTPAEIYDRPKTRFVAGFIGEIDLFDGVADGGRVSLPGGAALPGPPAPPGPATLAVRPEKVRLVAPADGVVTARIVEASFLGASIRYVAEAANGQRLLAEERNEGDGVLRPLGSEVGLTWRPEDAVVIEACA